MNRFLAAAAMAALAAGCARPGVNDAETARVPDTLYAPVEVAVEPTYVVQEIRTEVPVYYVDTVYFEEEPPPAETVVVVQEYENWVVVREPAPRWRRGHPRGGRHGQEPPEREPPPRGERPDDPGSNPPAEPTPTEETAPEETQPRREPVEVAEPLPGRAGGIDGSPGSHGRAG